MQSTTRANVECNEPPYSVFTIHMENLEDSSIRLKIWRDTKYKHVKRKTLMPDIKKWLFSRTSLANAASVRDTNMAKFENAAK